MKKPRNRLERVTWISRKLGERAVRGFEFFTDKQIKDFFDVIYPKYANKPDYAPSDNPIFCLICGYEVEIIHNCNCVENGPVIDELDPVYQEYLKEKLGE